MSMKTVLMVILLFMVAMIGGCEETLEVGQVWETTYDDPFENRRVLHKIIALKKGYVQSERLDEAAKGAIGSMREAIFRAGNTKLLEDTADVLPDGSTAIYGPSDAIGVPYNELVIDEPRVVFERIPLEGHLRWISKDKKAGTKAHFEYYSGDEWTALDDTPPDPNAPPIWGKGELPADHQDFFGNDNTARLDYVQNKVLDKHAAILKIIAIRVLALEAVDPNAMRLEALESGMEKLVR